MRFGINSGRLEAIVSRARRCPSIRTSIAMAGLVLLLVICGDGRSDAAEIKVLASGALKGALSRLLTDFQESSGHTVIIEYGPAGAIVGRIEQDNAADVVIVSRPQLQKLEGNLKIAPGSPLNIAGISLGVAVRKGAPKPDVSTVDAFKNALLAARSVGYRDPRTGSTSGIYTASLLKRLGIAEDLKPKLVLDKTEGDVPENVFLSVARGEVELQIGQISEIIISPGVDLAGPLPAEIQKTTLMAAGIATTSKAPDAAKAFITFISSPAAVAVLKANGLERPDKK
jgi:molybdate transport system substrate-binding protein